MMTCNCSGTTYSHIKGMSARAVVATSMLVSLRTFAISRWAAVEFISMETISYDLVETLCNYNVSL